MLEPTDDLRHDLLGDANAQESILGNVLLPDERLYVMAHFTMRASGLTRRMLAAFVGDEEPVFDVASATLSSAVDFSDDDIVGMHVAQPERLRTMTLGFEGERIGLSYRFEGLHEAFDFDRCRDGAAPCSAKNRFEQAGRISGRIRLDQRDIPFQTTGQRDHSWGPRHYAGTMHYKWIAAQAGPDLAIQAAQTWYYGRQYLNGSVFRDGLLSPIVDLQVKASYDDRILQKEAEFVFTDQAGRVTRASAQRFAGAFVPLGLINAEAAFRFSIENQDGVGVFSQGWQADYLEYLRKEIGPLTVGFVSIA